MYAWMYAHIIFVCLKSLFFSLLIVSRMIRNYVPGKGIIIVPLAPLLSRMH